MRDLQLEFRYSFEGIEIRVLKVTHNAKSVTLFESGAYIAQE